MVMAKHLCKWLYPSGTVVQHTALNVKTEVQNPPLALTERKLQSTCVNGCIPVGQWFNTQLIIFRSRFETRNWHREI
jgi:hypothetical protein